MSDTTAEGIARSLARLGWIGVWIQLVLAVTPLCLLGYFFYSRETGSVMTLDVTDYLAFVGLAILGFTTCWSFRYTRLAKRVADRHRRPPRDAVSGVLWVGVWASCLGIAISLLLLFIEVFRLAFLFMKAPQGGIPVLQTQPESRAAWVSAIDAVTLLVEVCTLAGELLVLGFSLWLLFKVTRLTGDYEQPTTPAAN